MTQLKGLDEDIEVIQNVMQIAYSSALIVEVLQDPSNNHIVQFNEYLKYTINVHWRLAIIELHKLFPNSLGNDKYAIETLIDNLEKNNYAGQAVVPQKYIDEWRARIVYTEKVLKEIRVLRNQSYGHERYDKIIKHNLVPDDLKAITDLVSLITNDILKLNGQLPFMYDMINYPSHDLKTLMQTLKDRDDYLRKLEEELH